MGNILKIQVAILWDDHTWAEFEANIVADTLPDNVSISDAAIRQYESAPREGQNTGKKVVGIFLLDYEVEVESGGEEP